MVARALMFLADDSLYTPDRTFLCELRFFGDGTDAGHINQAPNASCLRVHDDDTCLLRGVVHAAAIATGAVLISDRRPRISRNSLLNIVKKAEILKKNAPKENASKCTIFLVMLIFEILSRSKIFRNHFELIRRIAVQTF